MNKFFLITVGGALGLLSACGGGGGGSSAGVAPQPTNSTVAAKTITTFDTFGVSTTRPQLMAVSGAGLLTVALPGDGRVDTFSLSTGQRVSTYNVTSPVGVALKTGSAAVYYSAMSGIYTNGGASLISDVGGNYTGLVFTSASTLYVGNIANGGSIDKYVTSVSTSVPSRVLRSFTGLPSGIAVYSDNLGTYLYVTQSDGNIAKVNTSNDSHANVAWGTFDHPSGIAIDSNGYAYVANAGPSNNGDHGYITKVKISDGTREVFASETQGVWQTNAPGFCGLSGLAIDGGYLYAANGECSTNYSGYANRNKILKIKLP